MNGLKKKVQKNWKDDAKQIIEGEKEKFFEVVNDFDFRGNIFTATIIILFIIYFIINR
jgi:hypothetical protein